MSRKFLILGFKPGQLLIEVIIAMGLISILVAAVVPLILSSAKINQNQSQLTQATLLAKEEIETAKAIKEEDWNNIYFPLSTQNKGIDNLYHAIIADGKWQLASGIETIVLDGVSYTRSLTIENVSRTGSNGAGELESIYHSLRDDPSTQKVTAQVSGFGGSPIIITEYFSRWQNSVLNYSDWSGESFDANNIDTTGSGEIALAKTEDATGNYGNQFLLTGTGTIGRLNAANRKAAVKFTASKTGTANQINLYFSNFNNSVNLHYRYGIQADSNGLPSGSYLSSADTNLSGAVGWRAIGIPDVNLTSGNIYYIVVSYDHGSLPAGTRYIDIRNSTPNNLMLPLNQGSDLNQNTLLFDGSIWNTQGKQPIYFLGFTDSTYEGNPYDISQTRSIFGGNFEGEKFTPSSDMKINALSLYLSKSTSQNPADNLHFWLKDLTDNSDLIPDTVFINGASLTTSYAWKTFNFPSQINLISGHQYRLYLGSPLSNSSRYYRIYNASSPASAAAQGINWDGTNSVVSRSSNSGSTWTEIGYIDFAGYNFTTILPAAYSLNGDLTSNTIDLAKKSGLNRLGWQNADLPAGTIIKFQLAANNDNSTWNFTGPDGTAGSFYTILTGENTWANLSNNRYLKYKVYLQTSDNTVTPKLSDIVINYSL